MVQQDMSLVKKRIMAFIEKNGPSLPTHVASELGQSMLFSSAFLAELLSEKKLLLSDMKVGSSPIYFISGQEPLLEKYSIYVKGKLGEAYGLLKEKKYLKDSEQLPPIRVALRSIKDFSKPFKFKDEIYWRYFTDSIENFLESLKENSKEGSKKTVVKEKSEEKSEEKKEDIIEKEGEKDVAEKEEEKDIVEKGEEVIKESMVGKDKAVISEELVKSLPVKEFEISQNISDKVIGVSFVDKVRSYLNKENIVILEETDIKKREFFGRGRIQSGVGEMEILVVGKDKKNILEKDVEKLMQEVIDKKMFILFLSTGEIAKKAKDIYREHKNLIRFVKI